MNTPRGPRIKIIAVAALAVSLGVGWVARAWHEKEHYAITIAAGQLLADQLPDWFIKGLATHSGQCAVDPDVFKDPKLQALRHAEHPEHYFDWEFFDKDQEIPKLRFDYYKLCRERKLDPTKVGTLPWAIVEWQQRLTVAMAEYRKWPDQPHAKAKVLVYAGLLAHYAADLVMPLHTTVHFDGRVAKPGDPSPKTGIHAKVDNLLRKASFPKDWLDGAKAQTFDDAWQGTWTAFKASNALVDKVYDLEAKLPALEQTRITDDAVNAFAVERARAGAVFLASLYRTAWEDSKRHELPHWLDRSKLQAFPYPQSGGDE